MSVFLQFLQYLLGRLLYPIRSHDSRQIIYCPAFNDISQPNMTIECDECGPSGSKMLPNHTCIADNGIGCFPELRWAPPASTAPVKEYVLICEDIDLPIPFLVIHHGLFWAIPPTATSAGPKEVELSQNSSDSYQTNAGWHFVPNAMGASYIGPGPPLGHGSHRYVFTIIALNEPLVFQRPEKTTKSDIKNAMVGKIIGWGQWIGTFERSWH